MARGILASAIVALALTVPGAAEAGVVKRLLQSVPQLAGPSSLTPDCRAPSGSPDRCTGPLPFLTCRRDGATTSCEVGLSPVIVAQCGYAGAASRHSCEALGVQCWETPTTRSCRSGSIELFRCSDGPDGTTQVSATCPEAVAALDRLLDGS